MFKFVSMWLFSTELFLFFSKNNSQMQSRTVIMSTFWPTGMPHGVAQQPTVLLGMELCKRQKYMLQVYSFEVECKLVLTHMFSG